MKTKFLCLTMALLMVLIATTGIATFSEANTNVDGDDIYISVNGENVSTNDANNAAMNIKKLHSLDKETNLYIEAPNQTSLNIPSHLVNTAQDCGTTMIIDTKNGRTVLEKAFLDKVRFIEGVDCHFSLKTTCAPPEHADFVGGDTVVNICMDIFGEKLKNDFEGHVIVKIPYELPADKDADDIMVFQLPEGGIPSQILGATYDDGFISFQTNHVSCYSFGTGDSLPDEKDETLNWTPTMSYVVIMIALVGIGMAAIVHHSRQL